ncbi:MAG: HipA N-terminal domain-containing protein [Mucilaginibacter sp.]|uniref:HipA N-terminal domain-containing protein n=1 Tax=Mucilaginibacter sp. TaxID=1882438 RepID=UPI0034E382EC
MARRAFVYYQAQLAGYLSENDEGYAFNYDTDYLNTPNAKPVSLTLPITAAPYQSKVLFSFFDGLIPEGWLLNVAQKYWKLKGNDRFELLLTLCRDTIGAVAVVPQEEVMDA